MEQKELTIEEKQQECYKLALEIAQLRKMLFWKQNRFNQLDTDLYKHFKSQSNESQSTAEDNQ